MTVHDGFDFWVGESELDDEAKASLDRANESVIPTVKMAATASAYWCRIGERTHIRLVLPEDEDVATDALARLHAAGDSALGDETRLLGAFRACGLLVPVWDLDPDKSADDYEAALGEFIDPVCRGARLPTRPSPRRSAGPGPGCSAARSRCADRRARRHDLAPVTAHPAPTVAAVIPAKDEADRIAATVRAVLGIPGVDLVVVVDDGSSDDTAEIARAAGAEVVRHARNRGKAAAMTTGAGYVARHEGVEGRVGGSDGRRPLLFVDGDLEDTAANLGVLVPPVLEGRADMTIATLPPQKTAGGGHGFVVRLARKGIEDLTGFVAQQPLSGMRCISRPAFDAASPLARGWGVEVGLTVDVLLAGLRVEEVPCELHHRVSGSDWRGQVHRAKQYRDVALALARRRARRGLR